VPDGYGRGEFTFYHGGQIHHHPAVGESAADGRGFPRKNQRHRLERPRQKFRRVDVSVDVRQEHWQEAQLQEPVLTRALTRR